MLQADAKDFLMQCDPATQLHMIVCRLLQTAHVSLPDRLMQNLSCRLALGSRRAMFVRLRRHSFGTTA